MREENAALLGTNHSCKHKYTGSGALRMIKFLQYLDEWGDERIRIELVSTREKVSLKLTFIFYSDYLIFHTNCCLLFLYDGTPTSRLEGNI